MSTVEWGLVDRYPHVPVIRGAEKYGPDRYVIPLVFTQAEKYPVCEGAVADLLKQLNSGTVPVVRGMVKAVLEGIDLRYPIRDVNDIIGRVLAGWLEDGVVKALIHIDRDTTNANIVKLELDSDVDRLEITVPDVGAENKNVIEYFIPVVSITEFDHVYVQPEPTDDENVAIASVQEMLADNDIPTTKPLTDEIIIMRGLTADYNNSRILVKIPELAGRRVFIGCNEYAVVDRHADGTVALTAAEGQALQFHLAQATQAQTYALRYTDDAVVLWYVSNGSFVNNVFKRDTDDNEETPDFKPVVLYETFGDPAKAFGFWFYLPLYCGIRDNDTIRLNGIELRRHGIDQARAHMALTCKRTDDAALAKVITDLVRDRKNRIVVVRTGVHDVEIQVNTPIAE